MNVCDSYKDYSNSNCPTVVLSTASPYKFAHDVLKAISGSAPTDAFKCASKLNEQTANPIPYQILGLKTKEKRFNKVINKNDTIDAVMEFIKQ